MTKYRGMFNLSKAKKKGVPKPKTPKAPKVQGMGEFEEALHPRAGGGLFMAKPKAPRGGAAKPGAKRGKKAAPAKAKGKMLGGGVKSEEPPDQDDVDEGTAYDINEVTFEDGSKGRRIKDGVTDTYFRTPTGIGEGMPNVFIGGEPTDEYAQEGDADTFMGSFFGNDGRREVAAYQVSRALGLDVVPETVLDGDDALQMTPKGAYPLGSEDEDVDLAERMEDEKFASQMQNIALFDLLTGNYDRTEADILEDRSGKLWAINNWKSLPGQSEWAYDVDEGGPLEIGIDTRSVAVSAVYDRAMATVDEEIDRHIAEAKAEGAEEDYTFKYPMDDHNSEYASMLFADQSVIDAATRVSVKGLPKSVQEGIRARADAISNLTVVEDFDASTTIDGIPAGAITTFSANGAVRGDASEHFDSGEERMVGLDGEIRSTTLDD